MNKMGTGVKSVAGSDPPLYRPLSPQRVSKEVFPYCND